MQPQEYVSPADSELDARIQREFEEVSRLDHTHNLVHTAQKLTHKPRLAQVRQVISRIVERTGKFSTIPEIFEKDHDENGHMDFVTSASNLRALNYGIQPADRLQVRTQTAVLELQNLWKASS